MVPVERKERLKEKNQILFIHHPSFQMKEWNRRI